MNSKKRFWIVGMGFAGFVILGLAAAGCDDDHNPSAPRADNTPPAIVTDLRASDSGLAGRTLIWTTPGDDDSTGQASTYDIRFGSAEITDQNWSDLLPVPASPVPGVSGTVQVFELPGSFQIGTWFFALRTADEVPNWSAISNVVSFDAAPTAYPLAMTENQLVDNFEQAHLDRNFQEYEELLGDNFQFWFSPEDLDLAPNGFFWDRATDIASTERMFNGMAGVKPDGTVQPPVQKIELALEPTEPSWRSADGEVVGGQTLVPPGTKKRRYSVSMVVYYVAGDVVSQVNGEELFYIVPAPRDPGNGVPIMVWKLIVWRDFGGTLKRLGSGQSWQRGVESINFGQIKALY
jgi:hypothetical protein